MSSDALYSLDHLSSESSAAAKPLSLDATSSSEWDRDVLGDCRLRLASMETLEAEERFVPADRATSARDLDDCNPVYQLHALS